MSPISVLIVDDHQVLLDTLSMALRTVGDIDVTAVATTGAEALARAAETKPDVALVDVSLPDFDGIEVTKRLRFASPDTKVIFLTASTDPAVFAQAMDAGACGYLMKESGLGEVTDAIRHARDGRPVVPASVIGRLLAVTPPTRGPGANLTKRELEVLALLGEGCDARGVSKALGITWHTARSYVKNVLMKLDAHSQLEAVSKATRLGILQTGPR